MIGRRWVLSSHGGGPVGRVAADKAAPPGPTRHWWLWAGVGAVYLVLNLLLVPTASFAYDEAGLLGGANDWLRYGLPLFYFSKTGAGVDVLGLLAEALAYTIRQTGFVSGVAAIHIAYKLPLLVANLGCAVSLARLAHRFGNKRPALVGLLWLFNPVGFWVAAGHGQIEPLSAFAAVGSLDLLLSGWPLAAGVLCALGAGVEYFPLAVVIAAVVLLYHHRLRLRGFGRFVAGLVGGLVASFAPVLAGSARLRSNLRAFAGGFTPTPSAAYATHTAPVSPYGLSIWYLLPHPVLLSKAALGTVAVLFVIAVLVQAELMVRRRSVDAERAACGTVGFLLVLTVLLDPITNPQFALIAAGGLFLLAVAFDLPVWAALVVPMTGLATYLVYQSPWVFFADLWAQRPMQLPGFPTSSIGAIFLARAFTLGSLAGLGSVVANAARGTRALQDRHQVSTNRPKFVLGVAVTSCAVLASLGAVPAFWSAVGARGPRQPLGLSGFIGEPTNDVLLTASDIQVHYGRQLAEWVTSGIVKPRDVVEFAPSPIFTPIRHNVATATPTARWPQVLLTLPVSNDISSYLIRMLVGSRRWTRPTVLTSSPMAFIANGHRIRPTSIAWSSPSWAVVNLRVQASWLGPSGQLLLAAPPIIDKWDSWAPPGGGAGGVNTSTGVFVGATPRSWYPILDVFPGSGSFSTPVDGHVRHFSYTVTGTGENAVVARTFGMPALASASLARTAMPFSVSAVLNVGFQFPSNAPFRYHHVLVIVGILYAIGLVGIVSVFLIQFKRIVRKIPYV